MNPLPLFLHVCALLVLAALVPLRANDGLSLTWSSVDGGGAVMSGGGYSLAASVGQADAGAATLESPDWLLKSGFWAFDWQVPGDGSPWLIIRRVGAASVSLSWYPEVPGLRLEGSPTLLPESWQPLDPGNPLVLPATSGRLFFRLVHPDPP